MGWNAKSSPDLWFKDLQNINPKKLTFTIKHKIIRIANKYEYIHGIMHEILITCVPAKSFMNQILLITARNIH